MVAETKVPYITTPATREGVARLIKEFETQMKLPRKTLILRRRRYYATGFLNYGETLTR